jgi:hypothetical protein
MDSQQMMELLLDMKATLATKEDRKIDKEEMIQEMRADRGKRKAEMEGILSKMEKMLTTTQAKTHVKLKELTQPREEVMQSAEEHQQVPNEDAMVIPVRIRKRWHRGREEAAGRRGEPKELNQGDRGSQEKLAAACRKASCRAKVAWRKRNVFRKSWTCGRKWPHPERWLPAVKDTGGRSHRETLQEGHSSVEVGEAHNAVWEERTQP